MSSPSATCSRSAVVIELADHETASARTVLSAALQLFGPNDPVDVLLVLPGVDVPVEEHGLLVQQLVLALVPDPAGLPEVLLVGPAELVEHAVLLQVQASGDVAADARAVVLLAAAARTVWDGAAPSPGATLSAEELAGIEQRLVRLEAEAERAEALRRTARRDVGAAVALHAGTRRPLVVLLFQHRAYWGAVATLWQALRERPDVDVRVVALDSTADGRGESTADFLVGQGVAPTSPGWLLAHLADVDALVLDNPYDELRPPALQVAHLARRGVRLVAVPYGGNAIAGPLMDRMLWDLPLQRLAWRAYLGSPAQAALFAEHCATGDRQVRVLGTPKADRVVRAADGDLPPGALALRRRAAGRPLVLWNPHFRVGPGGWSTFETYLEPLLQRFAADPSQVLLLRPHFRLWPDLQALGGPGAGVERVVRAFVARHENVLLDESPDCLDALAACDALLSDLSSLATELLPTGKPVLYLHRADGPGPNEEGRHFEAMYRADGWDDVAAFLDMLGRGEDPRRQERRDVVLRDLPHADGSAGERIAEELVTALLGELAARDLPAGPAPLRVRAAELTASHLRLVLDGAPDGLEAELVGSHLPPVPIGADLVLPLRQQEDDERGPALPPGRFALRLGDAGYRLDPTVWSAGPRAAADGLSSVRLVPEGEELLLLEVEPPRQPAGAEQRYARGRRAGLRAEVLFTAFHGGPGACNPLAVQRELVRQGCDLPHLWVVRDRSMAVPAGCRPVLHGSPEWYEALGRSRYVVDNDAMPEVLDKRPGQVLLQTWHGTPLKQLRWDADAVAPRSREHMVLADRDAGQWDVVLSGSPLTSEVLRRAFRAGGTVLESGQPRNDVLVQPGVEERRARARARLGLADDDVVVLHAPTWRDGPRPSRSGGQLDLPRLSRELGPRAVVLHRDHRFVAMAGAPAPGVRDVTRHPDMAGLLLAADALVTDYSSSLFDFALTGRPTVFHVPDLEHYRDRVRGFYLDPQDLPGPLVRTLPEVAAQLADLPALTARYAAEREAFVKEHAPWDDGGAAERVVAAVFG